MCISFQVLLVTLSIDKETRITMCRCDLFVPTQLAMRVREVVIFIPLNNGFNSRKTQMVVS